MKMKCFLAALIILIVLLPGCRNSPTSTEKQESSQSSLPQSTLTFYFPQLTDGEKPDTKLVLSEVENLAADSLKIQLDFNWLSPEMYGDMILGMLSAGEELDAFYCGLPGQALLDFTILAREGLLADLTDALPHYAPGLVAQYDQNDLNCALVDGRLFAVPSLFPMTDNVYAIVRQDFMESYGLPAIETFADYEQYLATISENETGIIPGKIADSTIALFARASGYAIYDKEHFLVYDWDDAAMRLMPWEQTAGFRTVASQLAAWAEIGYLDLAGQGAGDIWKASDMIIKGKISSFLFAGEYRIGETIGIVTYSLNNYFQSNKIEGAIAAYRLYPDLQAQRLNPVGNGLTTGSLALPANTEDVARTLMFLDWVQSSQDNYDLFTYGIEGKHYQRRGEQLGFPEGITIDQNPYLGWDGRQAFKNLAYERFVAGLPAEAKEAYADQIRNHTVLAPHEGFYADVEHLADLLDQRKQMIIASIEIPLLTGTLDINDLDFLTDELNKTGTGKIIEDIQAQLESYNTP